MHRWRGLKSLIVDAVDNGSRVVERLQKETAKAPFTILEQIPPLSVTVKGIHEIHDTAVSSIHGMIRLVNRVTGETLDAVLDAVEQQGTTGAPRAAAPATAPEAKQPTVTETPETAARPAGRQA